jgi:hypothetical protein
VGGVSCSSLLSAGSDHSSANSCAHLASVTVWRQLLHTQLQMLREWGESLARMCRDRSGGGKSAIVSAEAAWASLILAQPANRAKH